MDKNKQWIDLIVELQSLAQAGLTYGKDLYDKERYEHIRDISAEMMAELSGVPVEKVKDRGVFFITPGSTQSQEMSLIFC